MAAPSGAKAVIGDSLLSKREFIKYIKNSYCFIV